MHGTRPNNNYTDDNDVYGAFAHHDTAVVRVYPVRLMNAD